MNTNPAGYTYSDYLVHQDDELYHFGIKGMKWGVRRGRRASGGSRRAPLTPEQKSKIKKRALQGAGLAAFAASHGVLYKKLKRAGVDDAKQRVAVNALRAGTGLYALHKSEQLRQRSMKTKDPVKAQQQRNASRILGVAGGVYAPIGATVTYGIHRSRDKERRRANPKKYREMGYVRN